MTTKQFETFAPFYRHLDRQGLQEKLNQAVYDKNEAEDRVREATSAVLQTRFEIQMIQEQIEVRFGKP